MKQPDKMTAYYYRAAHKQTDKHLDNQMHRLLTYAQENDNGTYLLFSDNGYSGVTADRPAFQSLLASIDDNLIQRIVVVSLDRLFRNSVAGVQFINDMAQRGISVYSITDGDLRFLVLGFRSIVSQYTGEKGGEQA